MTYRYEIRTIVVEDEEQNLNSICNKIVSLDNSFKIVGKAVNGQEALQKIEEIRPQVLFTDISMPVMGGMELIRRVRQSCPSIIIVNISGYSDFAYAQGAIKYGVFNYLLKPLESDALLETLVDIRQNLSVAGHSKERYIAYSDNYQLLADHEDRFLVMAVCLGNIIYDAQDEDVVRFYTKEIGGLPWNQILLEVCGEKEWFVTDEHVINQKIIGIKFSADEQGEALKWAKQLMMVIRIKTFLPVNLCVTKGIVKQEELWDDAKRLRNTLRRRLVIGEEHIFFPDSVPEKSEVTEIVKVKLNAYIKNYYNSRNLENFINEIRMIFKFLKSSQVTQDGTARICVYVCRLLEFSEQEYGRENIEEVQGEMMRSISISISKEELFGQLLTKIESLNCEGDEEDKETRLIDYIDEKFLSIDSMEQVAEEFGYNYAYLSRLFKKKSGMSMNKYITKKKIEFAKTLIQDKPDMRLSEISDLCGYEDSRYFSRVFKRKRE